MEVHPERVLDTGKCVVGTLRVHNYRIAGRFQVIEGSPQSGIVKTTRFPIILGNLQSGSEEIGAEGIGAICGSDCLEAL
jgi:hypothetical protein